MWLMRKRMGKSKGIQKNPIYFCFTDYTKAFDCVDHNKLRKILKQTGIPDHLTCLLRNLYVGQEAIRQVKLEPDMKQTGSKLGRNTSRLFTVTLLIYLIGRVHHVKCQVGWSTDWNQDCREKHQQPQINRWHDPYGKKQRTKEPRDKSERGEWLKIQHS